MGTCTVSALIRRLPREFFNSTACYQQLGRSWRQFLMYIASMNQHESAFVESFIVKPRRERILELLASSKNRYKFTSKFDHHGRNYIVPECIRPFQPRYQHASEIEQILRSMGAPATCHFIGGKQDGEDVPLLAALREVAGYGIGTVLSCVPGKLAYFEAEIRDRFLLVRT